MRQLVVDQLRPEERQELAEQLGKRLEPGPMEGMYWLKIPEELWEEPQQGHEECGPFYFAVELGESTVSFELLVRSLSNLHCSCIGYATPRQRDFLLGFVDELLGSAGVKA